MSGLYLGSLHLMPGCDVFFLEWFYLRVASCNSRLHFSSFPCGCYLLVPFSLLSYRLTVNLLYLNDGYRGEETPRDRDEERRDPRSNARKPTCWINIVSVSCGSMWYTPCGKEINSWRAYGYISIENAGPPSRKTHMKIR